MPPRHDPWHGGADPWAQAQNPAPVAQVPDPWHGGADPWAQALPAAPAAQVVPTDQQDVEQGPDEPALLPLSWEAPHPGECIRVLMQDADGEGEWADVVQRQEREGIAGLFCETVKSRRPFWFAPGLVDAGADQYVRRFERAEEDDS
eukprot:5546848-Amphidinium_carterae.1